MRAVAVPGETHGSFNQLHPETILTPSGPSGPFELQPTDPKHLHNPFLTTAVAGGGWRWSGLYADTADRPA